MKKHISLVLSVLLVFVAASALASPLEAALDSFVDELVQLQTQTRFLTQWNEVDQIELINIINRYGLNNDVPITLEQYLYPDAYTILQDAFISVYGDAAFWTLEQAYQRDSLFVSLGLQDAVYHVLPTEETLSPQKALDIAYDAILKHAEYYHYGTDNLDKYRISLQYVQYKDEGAPQYLVHYYLPDRMFIVFDVTIQQNGACSVSYRDPLSMLIVYQDWYYSRNFTRFIRWGLPDKQAFFELLSSLFEHEMECYGDLPTIGKTVLSHIHSVPTDNEMQPNEALSIALEELQAQSIDVSALTVTFSFYRDDPDTPCYEIAWVDDTDHVQHTVFVDIIKGIAFSETSDE